MTKNILIILFLFSTTLFAQSDKEKKAEKYYQKYSFDKAIEEYNKIDNLQIEELQKLAESYHNRDDFSKAENTYDKFINTNSATVEDYFNYILLLKVTGKYEEVKHWMEQIQAKQPSDLRAKSFFETEAEFQDLLIINPEYIIANLKMNSQDEDFGTAYFNDKIVFTSSRKGASPIIRNYNWNRKPFLDIFVGSVDSTHEIQHPVFWNKKVNQKWHEGPASFAEEGTYVAFTRNNYSDTIPDDDVIRLQLFFSEFKDGKWTLPEAFYLNNPTYSVGHPCLTQDGKKMFFVSDMPGGYGGTDIYYVEKTDNNQWGKPINLGDKINTEGKEMFPFYEEKSGLLFFSSNGLNGLGGLDVFVANTSPDGFSCIKNLGKPINTQYDDFAYIIDQDLTHGYFSSNRPEGKGGDDIYKFSFLGEYICQPIETVAIEETMDSVQPIDTTTRLVVNEDNKIILRNIHYDFDKWDILPESTIELDKVVNFMNENPSLIVELGSHTDCRGSDAYNLKLSQKRANSAVQYIISKGIDKNRITAKGYGETQLMNRCDDGVNCTEQEHRENRRTEIYIPEYGKAENVKQVKGKE